MDDLSTTTGIVAAVAGLIAIVALVVAVVAVVRLRRLSAQQEIVLGDTGKSDLVGHASRLQAEFGVLHDYVEDVAARLDERLSAAELRLDGSITYHGLVRYDAYNEMSGRQSTTVALLDATRSGVIVSSIHHRDSARMYAKLVRDGKGELTLSPEEELAVELALSRELQAEDPSA
ncbi:DUF4446 family protein [Paraconexibacter sp.]|uniref:DUF4446 family protein n=1 Tax=Paraconexibacter sp. TaxID=2949640 RepID=UPI003561797E